MIASDSPRHMKTVHTLSTPLHEVHSEGSPPSFGNGNKLGLGPEKAWNNKNGWFKLAHVCHNWRSIVLASRSRLRLRLFFTDRTPTWALALARLPPLPIFVGYNRGAWTVGAQNRLISALRYPGRVCAIAYTGSYASFGAIHKALDSPFPTLESLELHNADGQELILPARFLRTCT
ncbi:hypothetical protein BJV74DRAFT_886607 [Russula compacta]|nr:hypothetical protein BJV74DRAFT_886607 [Russula compacta]